MHLPTSVDDFLRANHELATAWELAALRMSRDAAAEAVHQGLLDRKAPGLFGGLARPAPWVQPAAAALRYLRRAADDQRPVALTGSAALALHGLDGFDLPPRPVVAVGADRRLRLRAAPLRIVRDPVTDPVVRHGLAVAPVGRALVDLERAEAAPDHRLRHGADAARWARALELAGWVEELRAQPRRTPRYLRLAESGVLDQESEGERGAFRDLFTGYPPPDCQVWLLPSVRVDFAYLQAALVIEYLGDVHAGRLQADTTRTYALQRAGYFVLLVVRSMLEDADELAAVIQRLRRDREALAARGLLPRHPLPPQRQRVTPLRTRVAAG